MIEDLWEGVRPHDIGGLLNDLPGTLGLLLVLGGLFLRSWASGVIQKKFRLTMEGPYALIRHPMYIGSFLIALGFSLIIGDRENIWVVLGLALIVYRPAIKAEEKELRKTFGEDYERYAKRVPAFIPRGIKGPVFGGWSIQRWLKHREYRMLFSAIIGLLLLKLLHEFLG